MSVQTKKKKLPKLKAATSQKLLKACEVNFYKSLIINYGLMLRKRHYQ